jgi:hypothetical protein
VDGSANRLAITAAAQSRWTSKPQVYPAFSEYHENNSISSDGISDTGTTIRAFLPLTDASTRSSIKTYNGKAAVVDTRVTCMHADITNMTLYYGSAGELPLIGGVFKPLPEFRNRPIHTSSNISWRLSNYTPIASPRNCSTPYQLPSGLYQTDDWYFSLCQLPETQTFLVSEFYDMDSAQLVSDTYLAVNMSLASEGYIPVGLFTSPPIRNTTDGEWLHLFFNITTTDLTTTYEYRVSISLCFTAFSSILSRISASASTNRTEPIPRAINGSYSFDGVRRQLGQAPRGSASE